MGIVKTGYCIDGIEVTSEHIGNKLEVLKSGDHYWLPAGFIATIENVYDNGVIDLLDTGGGDSSYGVDLDAVHWEFKWVTLPKPKKPSTKSMRQKLAKAVREAKTVLGNAIKEAEEVGMVVSVSGDGIKITFNPPVEEY